MPTDRCEGGQHVPPAGLAARERKAQRPPGPLAADHQPGVDRQSHAAEQREQRQQAAIGLGEGQQAGQAVAVLAGGQGRGHRAHAHVDHHNREPDEPEDRPGSGSFNELEQLAG
jgi:hypothetical protein